jgi:hypothetical protein
MSRFLKYLNISIDSNTPLDIIQGGQIIDGLQAIYEDMPDGSKKDNFASMIGETASILIKRINEMSSLATEQAKKELEEMEKQSEQKKDIEAKQIVQELENRPNPVQDTSLDDVDPPIENGAIPTTDEDNTENTELQDLINTIHNLKF